MSNASESSYVRRATLATGAGLAGAYAGLRVATWLYRRSLPSPLSLPPALDLEPRIVEAPDGRVQYYARPGTGPPVVLLHSVNAVASSREMKPIAEHLVATTDRPLYALDWLGFGRSLARGVARRPPAALGGPRPLFRDPGRVSRSAVSPIAATIETGEPCLHPNCKIIFNPLSSSKVSGAKG